MNKKINIISFFLAILIHILLLILFNYILSHHTPLPEKKKEQRVKISLQNYQKTEKKPTKKIQSKPIKKVEPKEKTPPILDKKLNLSDLI